MQDVFRGGRGCVFFWSPNLVMCKILRGGPHFEGMKGSWRAAKSWFCERPGKASGECAASVLKGLFKKVEAWHHEESR